MLGETLRQIREDKDLKMKDVAFNIFSPSQLTRIENGTQIPAADKFFHLLARLNVDFEEFALLSKDESLISRTHSKRETSTLLRSRDRQLIRKQIKKMERFEQQYQESYFTHLKLILKGYEVLYFEGDVGRARENVSMVMVYLDSVDKWYFYELEIFNMLLPFYTIEKAIELGNLALQNIKLRFQNFKDNELTRKILTNLAHLALQNERLMAAYDYSSTALGLPMTARHLYDSTVARVINQIVCFKLENGQYDPSSVKALIDCFYLLKMDGTAQRLTEFLKEYGIELHV